MYTYIKISMFVYRFLCACPSNVVVVNLVSRSVLSHSILVWGTGSGNHDTWYYWENENNRVWMWVRKSVSFHVQFQIKSYPTHQCQQIIRIQHRQFVQQAYHHIGIEWTWRNPVNRFNGINKNLQTPSTRRLIIIWFTNSEPGRNHHRHRLIGPLNPSKQSTGQDAGVTDIDQ